MNTKQCTKCGEVKGLGEYGYKSKANGTLLSRCKICRNKYNAKYREENKEKIREYFVKYTEENKEKLREWRKKYTEENKEKIREYNVKYRKENKEKFREYFVKYTEENKEKFRELKKKYTEENKEKLREWRKKYNEENKEKLREKNRINILELQNSYVLRLLKKKNNQLIKEEIPDILIESKRLEIKLLRQSKTN